MTREAERQFGASFEGRLQRFDLPLDVHGTPVQQRVRAALLRVLNCETRSYGQIAWDLGDRNLIRAWAPPPAATRSRS